MRDQTVDSFEAIDAYTLADGAQRAGVGNIIHSLRPQTTTTRFIGRALTARVHYEPHRQIPLKEYGGWRLHDRAGPNDVAVLDGGGLPLTAMGALAVSNLRRRGAAGAVVNACVRDVEEVEELKFPFFALDAAISTIAGNGFVTDIGEPVNVQGFRIATGDLIGGCRGGIVVVPWDQRHAVLEEALRILESDRLVREGIGRGEAVGRLWDQHKDIGDAKQTIR